MSTTTDNDRQLEALTSNFNRLWQKLSPKEQRKSMTSAMRREANRLKRTAKANIKASGLSTRTGVDRGVYARVYPKRYGLGFMVSVKPHGKRAIHTNRQGKQKPVLMFAEEGTTDRNVGTRKSGASWAKGKYAAKRYRQYKRTGHSTGRMPKYGFIERTEQTETAGIEQRLFADFERNVAKAAEHE